MNHKKVIEALTTAQSGSKKVRIRFIREATDGAYYLLQMGRAGSVEMDGFIPAILMAVVASRDWENDDNRTVEVTITDKFQPDKFRPVMADFIEAIEVVNS
jgi:hypothetical protein